MAYDDQAAVIQSTGSESGVNGIHLSSTSNQMLMMNSINKQYQGNIREVSIST